ILTGIDYKYKYRQFGLSYPNVGYGFMFDDWLKSDGAPYGSFGNGSAMRVSPVGWAYDSLEETLLNAKISAECTHNHIEGIKAAEAVCGAIFLARNGASKSEIREFIVNEFYVLDRSLRDLQAHYSYSEKAIDTVPEAIIAFLESSSFEDSIRKTISIGGDVDTLCAINGSIAHAYYGDIPESLIQSSRSVLSSELIGVIDQFNRRYLDPSQYT
ncbi:MAG: ADP-ribosylglycohydrolase family protein, partial [Bacteriovoracaceae bacterium]|nr:ADP-ribosylglycohydrolase family protein [Bacteriovoracaceae bacterium]